jgi:hypothetical protein
MPRMVFVSCYEAACINAFKAASCWRNTRRCSGSEFSSPIGWRRRKWLRNSSNAQQKRAADAKVPASAHRIVPLFDATMILLQPIIEILVRPMVDLASHRFTNGSRIRRMTISCGLFWHMANYSDCLLEELFCSAHISLLAQSRIDQIAVVINRPVEGTPLSTNLDRRFVNVALPHLRSAFSLPLLRAKCGVHETIKGRRYVRQCASGHPMKEVGMSTIFSSLHHRIISLPQSTR